MGLINYLGESKIIKRICELLNVTDVQVDGVSVVDSDGIAQLTSGGGSDLPLTVENGKLCIIYDDGQ